MFLMHIIRIILSIKTNKNKALHQEWCFNSVPVFPTLGNTNGILQKSIWGQRVRTYCHANDARWSVFFLTHTHPFISICQNISHSNTEVRWQLLNVRLKQTLAYSVFRQTHIYAPNTCGLSQKKSWNIIRSLVHWVPYQQQCSQVAKMPLDTVLICEVLHLCVTMKGTDYCLNSFNVISGKCEWGYSVKIKWFLSKSAAFCLSLRWK